MTVILGADGGGTKTDCLLVDENGKTLAHANGRGISHRQYGVETAMKTLAELATACATEAGIAISEISSTCIGLPLYGEMADLDAEMKESICRLFPKVHLVNDVEVGWAGSLGCSPGIHVVAGTGAIAFGRDEKGQTCRCGGWSEHFSDEGSSYWLGLRGMGLFTKQADGRVEKGALYTMVREQYGLKDNYEFVAVAERELLPHRDKVAAFQKLLCDAAEAGDTTVPPLYAQAGRELAELAVAIEKQLSFETKPVAASYSGGTYKAGSMLLEPFKERMEGTNLRFQPPRFTPVQGAVLLAARELGVPQFSSVLVGLEKM